MIPVAQFSGFGSCEINRADTVKALFGLIHRTQEAMGRARILQWHPTPKLGSSMMPNLHPQCCNAPNMACRAGTTLAISPKRRPVLGYKKFTTRRAHRRHADEKMDGQRKAHLRTSHVSPQIAGTSS
ncbi:hypothetical protein V490_08153 [Pseudogymnoascus sp. VKM F-3557]|nr:hypothetical protein V490_08153 [Pseudogymnoascus sp. VKM F-3557]